MQRLKTVQHTALHSGSKIGCRVGFGAQCLFFILMGPLPLILINMDIIRLYEGVSRSTRAYFKALSLKTAVFDAISHF